MNPFSTPYENVLSMLSTSDAWKKYFPGIQKDPTQVAYSAPKKDSAPPMKGIDFTTGKNVDLGKYWEDKGTSVGNYWNPEASAEPPSNELMGPAYEQPASPLSKEDIQDILDYQRKQTRQTRAEEAAYNIGMMYPLQEAVTSTALQMRQADLQNRLAGETARQNMPESYAQRSNVFQQGQALASGAFATELGAVSEAASRARRDVVAGLMAGRGRA
jgi:hypothetical protein